VLAIFVLRRWKWGSIFDRIKELINNMNKKIIFGLISIPSLIIVAIMIWYFLPKVNVIPIQNPVSELNQVEITNDGGTQTICTQEVKQCPDGSYVSRTGPNCEFSECPEIISSSTSTPACNIRYIGLCSDGSYAKKIGPGCKFEECPTIPQLDTSIILRESSYLNIVNFRPGDSLCEPARTPYFIPNLTTLKQELHYTTWVHGTTYMRIYFPGKISNITNPTFDNDCKCSSIGFIGDNNGSWIYGVKMSQIPAFENININNFIEDVLNNRSGSSRTAPYYSYRLIGTVDRDSYVQEGEHSFGKKAFILLKSSKSTNDETTKQYWMSYQLEAIFITDTSLDLDSENAIDLVQIIGPSDMSRCIPGDNFGMKSALFIEKYRDNFEKVIKTIDIFTTGAE
jgi:hypothetical protein